MSMRICGLDEVGRGCLAGPLVAAAVVLNKHNLSLKDSKKLTPKQRRKLYNRMKRAKMEFAVESISARQINNRGMAWANKQIFKNLINRIEADRYIVDGSLKIRNAKSLIKADGKIKCVMAASIVAKVERDRLMTRLHKEFPKYGWKSNVGYGTKYHIQAIKEHGMSRYHRSVFVTTALRDKVTI